jgi:hypothetical protein
MVALKKSIFLSPFNGITLILSSKILIKIVRALAGVLVHVHVQVRLKG